MGNEHSAAVNSLIQDEMPKVLAFNKTNVYFTGVSGGSLMIGGFFVPTYMKNYPNTGVLLQCGGLSPQVDFQDAQMVMQSTRIHFPISNSQSHSPLLLTRSWLETVA